MFDFIRVRAQQDLLLRQSDAAVQRAIRRSTRRGRQIWMVWTGCRLVLRMAYRRGGGILIARVIGDEIFPA